MKKVIITIGRQYGSGGRFIGKRLAEELGIPFYDRELIAMSAAEGNLDANLIEQLDERSSNRFFYSLPGGGYINSAFSGADLQLSMSDKLFLMQCKVIKRIADEGSAVIVGRCSDYVLKEYKEAIHVFIHADMESKIKRVTSFYGVSPEKAAATITKTDKIRAKYHNYYTGRKWGAAENYTLAIDSGIGIEEAAAVIKKLAEEVRKK